MTRASDPAPGINHDLCEAERSWGRSDSRSLIEIGDLWKAVARLGLAMHLAQAAVRDPRAFRITALAVRRHRALQKPLELFDYLRFLRRRPLARCMEIGTLWGGTFFAHCAVTVPTGHVIAVDSFPREHAGQMTSRFRQLARKGQRVTCVWHDSQSNAAEVAAALDGALLDLLFIDGDHSSAGVRRDYDLYSPLVRSGGVIAFHDIDARISGGVPAFWRSLRRQHDSLEFVDHRHAPHGLGIGVIVKP